MANGRKSRQRPAPRGSANKVAGRFLYVESSALLAVILEHDSAAMRAIRRAELCVTSALTFTEANRVVVRARVAGRLTTAQERGAAATLQTFERRCTVVAISNSVLSRAGHPYPAEPLKTLDAIHLATAELLGGPPQLVTILTRDARVRENAAALGYGVA